MSVLRSVKYVNKMYDALSMKKDDYLNFQTF